MQITAASEINSGSDKELRHAQWVGKTVRTTVDWTRSQLLCIVIHRAGILLKGDSEK